MSDALSDSSRKIQRMVKINFSINEVQLDLQEQFQQILEAAIFCTDGESASVLLSNTEDGSLYFETTVGVTHMDLTDLTIGRGEGIAGWVAENNRSLIINDVNADKRFLSRISRFLGYETHAILAVPLRVQNHCLGVIEIVNKKNNVPFTDEDRQWAEVLANQAGLAIINSRLNAAHLPVVQKQEQVSTQLLIYQSAIMKALVEVIEKIALTDASVLITGESGVGKELVAEQIHVLSPRSNGPLSKNKLSSLPEQLLESELFGHVKGAFTDAVKNRQGKLEVARGGTVFLDEIADIPLAVQAKLLRVLETKRYESLGSNQIKIADVRIISASNKSLKKEVQSGRFREDLFYRLNIIPLTVPPLRRRREDIPLLAENFLKKINIKQEKNIQSFSPEAFEQLMRYSWPGNIRELYNSIERSVALCTGSSILPEYLLLAEDGFNEELYQSKSLKGSVDLFKKHLIRSTLIENDWNQTRAAKKLEIQRTYLSRLVKEFGIERSST